MRLPGSLGCAGPDSPKQRPQQWNGDHSLVVVVLPGWQELRPGCSIVPRALQAPDGGGRSRLPHKSFLGLPKGGGDIVGTATAVQDPSWLQHPLPQRGTALRLVPSPETPAPPGAQGVVSWELGQGPVFVSLLSPPPPWGHLPLPGILQGGRLIASASPRRPPCPALGPCPEAG